jgi:CRP-like cAMP-binding protein
MPVSPMPPLTIGNRLLSALNREEYERLLPHLERVQLNQGRVITEATDHVRHAYFLTSGMISLLSITEAGETIEVAMIGNEGMLGIPIILKVNISPYRTMVQIPGDALRIKADALSREFARCGQLHELLLKFTHALVTQISQSAVCNHFHKTEARLSRWLLIAQDRARSDSFMLTQEALSHMLGAPRTGVTRAAVKLQDQGLISYRRGRIKILDQKNLESVSCECYEIVKHQIDQFLAA